MSLPCEIRWDRDVPIRLRDGGAIYTDIPRPVGDYKKLSADFMPIQSFDQPQPLHPGEIVLVDIAIMPASQGYHAGQQLRLTIAGHEFKAALAPPPAGVLAFMRPLPPASTHNAGVHVIHGGSDHPSFLQMPVIPTVP
jgi:predicted acyl esterase